MIKSKNSLGVFLLLLLLFIPFLILYLYQPAFFDFKDFYTASTTIAKSFGIVGILLLCSNIIMSGRFHFLESLFGGLDWVYRVHSFVGKLAYILLFFHVTLMGVRYMEIDPSFIPVFFKDISTLYIVMGKVAFALITFAAIVAVFRLFPYQVRKRLHKLMGIGLLFAGAHAYLAPSDVAIVYPLRVYVLGFVSVALLSFVHRSLLGGVFASKYRYVVSRVARLGGDIVEVTLKPKGRKMVHFAGQFQFIRFFQHGFSSEEHPFTISSGENEKVLRLSIKNSGDYTSDIDQIEKGTQAIVEGPFGGFTFRNSEFKRQIWVAGGIGITPFLSMARTLGTRKRFGRYQVSLFYSYSTPKDGVFVRELKDIAKKTSNFNVYPVCSSKEGRLSVQKIIDIVDELDSTDVYICGPSQMVAQFRKDFRDNGVSGKNVRFEEFKLL